MPKRVTIHVGTSISQDRPVYPVLCEKHGCNLYGLATTAAKAAKEHGDRAHGKNYEIQYTKNAEKALQNEAAMLYLSHGGFAR